MGVSGLRCPKATAPGPTKASSTRSWMEERFYGHIASGPDPSFFRNSEKFLSSPTIISITASSFGPFAHALCSSVLHPRFRDAAFLNKRSVDLVGWPMYLNIENGINCFRD